MDQAITRAACAESTAAAPAAGAPRAVGEFKGYVDGEPAVRWFDRKNMPQVGDKLFAAPVRAAGAEPRTWALLLTSENHGTVGPVGSTFPHAGEKHERVQVMEIVEAGAAPAPGTDLGGLVRITIDGTVIPLAAPSAPVGASVDTPALDSLLATFSICDSDPMAPKAAYENARAALIAHIDQHVASQVRAARDAQRPGDDDLLEVARTLCSIAARRGELAPEKRQHYPHADEEGSPVLAAAHVACVARGYTQDGLAINGVNYPITPGARALLTKQAARDGAGGMVKANEFVGRASVAISHSGEGAAQAEPVVLTDEMIIEVAAEEDYGDEDPVCIIRLARRFEREVAAQAGQVAVPGWISVDERLPEFRHECTSSGCEVSDSLMVYGQNEFGTTGCGFGHARDDGTWATYEAEYDQLTVVKVTHWMPLPSKPASESLRSPQEAAGTEKGAAS